MTENGQDPLPTSAATAEISLYAHPGGSYQIAIETANGGGYRLAGLKFDGNSRRLMTVKLTKRDRDEIRGYLDRADEADA